MKKKLDYSVGCIFMNTTAAALSVWVLSQWVMEIDYGWLIVGSAVFAVMSFIELVFRNKSKDGRP